jgi:N-acetylneuraminic acid mutarotase
MNRKIYSTPTLALIILIGLTFSLTPPDRIRATPSSGGCWYYKTDMPTHRRGMAAVELNNQVYVMGGQNGESYILLQRYDPNGSSGGTWESLKTMPTARSWLVAGVANPEIGKPQIYAIGGSNLPVKYATVEMYDPGSDTWFTKAPMNHARFGAVAGVVNNKIYVIGGWRGSALDYVEEYDPVNDTWTDKQSIPEPVAMAGSAVVEGKIYVIGGINDTDVLSSVYEYDPAADTWMQKRDMPSPSPDITIPGRNRLAAVAVADEIFIIGGINPQNRWLDTVQVLEPATDTWTTMNWMPTKRGEIAAASVDNTIYVFGGRRSWDNEVVNYTQALNIDCANYPPNKPADPDPIPGWNNQPVDLTLSWSGGDLDGDVTYDVYLEGSTIPIQDPTFSLVSSNQVPTTFAPPETLKPFTKYYWRIVAQDDTGAVTSGDLWGFWTGAGPIIDVHKQANPEFLPDSGGMVTYTLSVSNIGDETVTLYELVDDVYGEIAKPGNPTIDSTTCSLPQTLIPDASYTCNFTNFESGNIGDILTDLVTASAENAEGIITRAQDMASVEIVNNEPNIRVTKLAEPDSLPETGGIVKYKVRAQNVGLISLTLTELNDDTFGDLENWADSDCALPIPLATGESYECTFSAFLSGNAGMDHINTVTAYATDDGGNLVNGSDEATVRFMDEQPEVRISKWANPASLTEPGGAVDFTVNVSNAGNETIYLAALEDDIYGDLNGQGNCELSETGPILAGGQDYQCKFTKTISGFEGDNHINTVWAAIYDDENNIVHRSDEFTVEIVDELPAISVTYTSLPDEIVSGSWVTFTVKVTNDNIVDAVNLVDLDDSVFGDLKTECDLDSPISIHAGSSWLCEIHRPVTHNHASTVTVEAKDEHDNTTMDSAYVEVDVFYLLAIPITLNKGL